MAEKTKTKEKKFAEKKEKNSEENNFAKRIVDEFFSAVLMDLFPKENIELLFGVKFPIFSPNSLSSMSIGQLVYGSWQALIKHGRLEKVDLEKALLAKSLQNLFEAACTSFLNELPRGNKNYMSELASRGFERIKWETDFVERAKGENVKTRKRCARFVIEEGPIEIAYGFDEFVGYFLAVTDARLQFDHTCSQEVQEIGMKIGIGDEDGSYFDLHTGKGGFGFKVSQETMAEYYRRYKVPQAHIRAVLESEDLD